MRSEECRSRSSWGERSDSQNLEIASRSKRETPKAGGGSAAQTLPSLSDRRVLAENRQLLPTAEPVKPESSEQPLQFDKLPNRYLRQGLSTCARLSGQRWGESGG